MPRTLAPCLLLLAALLAPANPARADALRDKPPFHQMATYKNMLVMDQIETNWLYDLSMDFIKNGLAEYYKTGNENYAETIYKSKGYSVLIRNIDLWAKDRFTGELLYKKYTRIVASGMHIENELWCVYQQEYQGIIYEYWLLKLRVEGRNYHFRYCEFILTRTPSRQDARQIFYSSQQFFNNYVIDDDFSIVFPEKAVKLLFYSHNYISCPDCCKHIEK